MNYSEAVNQAKKEAMCIGKAMVVKHYNRLEIYSTAMAYSVVDSISSGVVVAFVEATGEVREKEFSTSALLEGVA